jgi:phage-related protein
VRDEKNLDSQYDYGRIAIKQHECQRIMKPLKWIGNSLKDLRAFPAEVQHEIGLALTVAQYGGKHPAAKPLRGFGGAQVLEVAEDYDGDTYRAVYTVRFVEVLYVLHCFQKKSTRGIKTTQRDIEMMKARLRLAQEEYDAWRKAQQQ